MPTALIQIGGRCYLRKLFYKDMIMKNSQFIIACVLMGVVILSANILVAIPVNDWFTYGALTFPICFLITDTVNRLYGVQSARKVVVFGFVVGVVLSLYFADKRIALASGMAFIMGQMLDVFVFDKLRQATWWKAPVFSSALSSVVDTALFFTIAFAGSGDPWMTWALGDLFAKYIMVVALIPAYRILLVWIVTPKPAESKSA